MEARIIASLLLAGACLVVATENGGEREPSCTETNLADLKKCFDPLVTMLNTEAPADILDFLCGTAKTKFECVIQEFNKCGDFVNENFIDQLKHPKSGFHANELFHLSSANEYCKCAPTNSCLKNIKIDQLSVGVEDTAFGKMANAEYICGNGHRYVDCVAKGLPMCAGYLQYKHNASKGGEATDFDISSLEYAGTFFENRCKSFPQQSHDCSEKRAKWHALKVCVDNARHYSEAEDKSCGLRICVEKNMNTCPNDDMGYYIDAVNVFSDIKISTRPCSTSSSSHVLATITTILLAAIISRFL